jgi:phenylacetate-CoA ligase
LAIDFSLRDFFAPVAILKLHRSLERTQWISEEELRAWQDAKLRGIVRHAVAHVPYYHDLFQARGIRAEDIANADDLARLPRLSRKMVHDGEGSFHADNMRSYGPILTRTSGSSGSPLEFYLDRASNVLEFVHYWRHWGWAGYRIGQRFAELASIHFLRRPYLDGKISDLQRGYGRLLLNAMRLSRANINDYAALMARFRPFYLKGLPSALFHLATLMEAEKASRPPLRAVFSNGENVTPQMRATIEAAFQCPLLDCYGHMERTACIAQCLEGSYHVLSDYGLIELADPKPSGEPGIDLATAIGTSLYNRAMPLLRYEIGDLIEVYRNPPRCRCGRSFPVVRGVRGRIATAIVTPEGRVESALFTLPSIVPGIVFMQFVQRRTEVVEVRVVRTESFNGECETALRRCLSEALGPSMEVRIRYVPLEETDKDPSGKRPVAISEIAPAISESRLV